MGISLHLFVIGGKDDMNEVSFVDTTLRDGQASLWAMGMRTGMILPVAEKMDQAGFEAIEMIGIAFVKKCVRELREDPWQRRMISNFRHQLSKVGLDGKLQAVLEETAKVRAEFGYPTMVTPYSQFVGVQAAMNVILGERYKAIPDEVVQYALGLWGEEESSSMDPDIRDRILGTPRAAELANWHPPQPSLKEVRRKFGGPGVSDDDLLLRYFAGEDEVATMRAAGPSETTIGARLPLMRLVEKLIKRTACNYIQVQKGTKSLTLGRGYNQP